MKFLIRTIFAFLFFILLQVFSCNSVESVAFNGETYIQNNSYKVYFVSENFHDAEFISKDENTNQDFFVGRIFFANLNSDFNDLLIKKSEKIANANIHNLSTNNLKSKYIRAP